MKKKIFGSIIFMILLIITSLYIYIDNFEITSEDLPTKNEAERNVISDEKIQETVKKEEKQGLVIKYTHADLIREKYLMMGHDGIDLGHNNPIDLSNEDKRESDADENLVADIEASTDVSKDEIHETSTLEESNKNSEEKTLDDETIEAAKEDAKTTDKAQAMALAVKRLSPEQIKRLMTISKGGFTAEEKAEALEMFYENFTKEEQEWILLKFEEYMGG